MDIKIRKANICDKDILNKYSLFSFVFINIVKYKTNNITNINNIKINPFLFFINASYYVNSISYFMHFVYKRKRTKKVLKFTKRISRHRIIYSFIYVWLFISI